MQKKLSIFSDSELNTEIKNHSKLKIVMKDSVLIKPGEEILFIPIVLKGSIRIIRQDEEVRYYFCVNVPCFFFPYFSTIDL